MPKRERRLLVLSRPPKPPVEMTDEEIDAWADEIFNRMKLGYEQPGAAPYSASS